MEVERWTLATGETAITGFTRLWKPWWLAFVFMAILPNVFPGFATGAATCLSFVIGDFDIKLAGIVALVAVGVFLTMSAVVYQAVERFQSAIIVGTVIWLVVAVFFGTEARDWGDAVEGLEGFGTIPFGDDPEVSAAVIAGAIAFAGSGGCGNLAVSNWVRDKGMGMGHYIPRIVSPRGEQEAVPATGTAFPMDERNLRRWKGWWKVANQEQAVTFWLIGTVGIVVLSVLAYTTVYPARDVGEGFDFIEVEGNALKDQVAPWFGTVFWLIGFFKLLSTMLGNFDYVSRITADAEINVASTSDRWSESRIYAATVWFLILVGIVLILTFTEQPLVLLVISSALSAIVMFIYSLLLIRMNRRSLPAPIRLTGLRLGVMWVAVAWFGFFSYKVIAEYGGQLF